MKSGRARPHLLVSSSAHLGGNFPISVAIGKSITSLSQDHKDSSSETRRGRHLPALHSVAFPTSLHTVFAGLSIGCSGRRDAPGCGLTCCLCPRITSIRRRLGVRTTSGKFPLACVRISVVITWGPVVSDIHCDGSHTPSFARWSVAVMFAAFVGLPLSLRRGHCF